MPTPTPTPTRAHALALEHTQSAGEVLATEWMRSFHASKNALGMLLDVTRRAAAAAGGGGRPPAVLLVRRTALRTLVAIKVDSETARAGTPPPAPENIACA